MKELDKYLKINTLSQHLLKAVEDKDAELMAVRFDELEDAYKSVFGERLDGFEAVHAFFQMMYAGTKYLSFNNFYDAARRNCVDVAARFKSICAEHAFSDGEISVLEQLSRKIETVYRGLPERHLNTFIPRQDTRCCLCRIRPANKTGSHMVPNFLAHPTFSYDGKGNRGREAMDSYYLNDSSYSSSYYGPEVPPERIARTLGREMTDEDIAGNINRLEYDNEFCSVCEARFGILETAYAAYYKNQTRAISPRVAYLFWLSVLWRMSLGRMGLFMEFADESSIQGILDSNVIGSIKEIADSNADLGDWEYAIFKAEGLKDGDKGIMASRVESPPYITMYNDLVMVFYHGSPADPELVLGPVKVKREDLNSWKNNEERYVLVDRRWFWNVRDWLIQQSYDYYDPARERAMLQAREIERTTGKAFSEEDKKIAVDVSRIVSGSEPQMFRIRKLDRIIISAIRKQEAEAAGREYDPLKDEELFLSQKDFMNFYEDIGVGLKIGRNDPCPCGSGKKYKKCCGKK